MDGSDDDGGLSAVRRVYDALRGRYFFKIGAAILVVAVVLLGAGYVTVADVQASVEDDAEATLVHSAEREAQGIDEFVRDRNADALRISSDEAVVSGTDDELRDELETNLELLPENVQSVHYYDMSSETIEVSSQPEREGERIDETDRPWAVEAGVFDSPGDVRSFEPYEVDGEKRLGFISPVEGQYTTAIVVTVDLAERSELLTAPVDGSAIEVVSTETGEVMLAEDTDVILDDYALLEQLPHLDDDVERSQVDTVETDAELVDDEQAVVATVPLEEQEWAVTVVAPESTVFDTVGDVTRSLTLLIGLALLGFVAVGAIISRDINGSLETMTGYAEEIEDGNLEVAIDQSRTDEFGQLAGLFARIRDTLGDQLEAVERQAQEAKRERERVQEAKADAETAQAEAQEAKADAEALSRHLERKASEYSETIAAAADGDLTRRLETTSESEAMTEIGEALNRMLDDIEQLVVRIQQVAQEVDERSTEVTASTEEIEASSTEVAQSIEEISAGAETQSEKLTTAAAEMGDLSATVEEIASSSETVAEQSQQAAEWGQEGQTEAAAAIETMDQIESKAEDTVGEMERLQTEVERIVEIVELIDDIADETNLLAMNASIEAANAADSGDGFAVVADEVKSLAEETAEATQEVEQLVETVEASTESVAEDMFEMQDGIEDGRETIDDTVETLESIVDRIDEANAGIQSINETTDDQADSAQEVATMVDDITAVSEQTTTEAQNVSAAAEEQTSAIQQIATSSESLSDRAEELQSLVNQFETDTDSSVSVDSQRVAADDD